MQDADHENSNVNASCSVLNDEQGSGHQVFPAKQANTKNTVSAEINAGDADDAGNAFVPFRPVVERDESNSTSVQCCPLCTHDHAQRARVFVCVVVWLSTPTSSPQQHAGRRLRGCAGLYMNDHMRMHMCNLAAVTLECVRRVRMCVCVCATHGD